MPQQSMLSFVFNSLGFYVVLLLLATVVSLVLTLLLVIRGRGPMAVGGLLLVVPLPLLVGVFGTLEGLIQALLVISSSSTGAHPSELALAYSSSAMSTFVGMLLMGPGYCLAVGGSVVRAIKAKPEA